MTAITTTMCSTTDTRSVSRSLASALTDGLKRGFDIVGAGAGLVVALPLILLGAAVVWIADPGPVMLGQCRVGRDGRLFRMYKLRTMYLGSEHRTGAACATRDDHRVIPACRWMRRCHLDELAQLWNVLRGEMSLVGPRPERPELMEKLQRHVSGFDRRLAVRPGLTGLAQVRMGYAAEVSHHRRKLRYDLLYIRRMSLWTDLKLIVATVAAPWDCRAA